MTGGQQDRRPARHCAVQAAARSLSRHARRRAVDRGPDPIRGHVALPRRSATARGADRRLPAGAARSSFDVAKRHARARTMRAPGGCRSGSRRGATTPLDYVLAGRRYLQQRLHATPSAPRAARRAGAAGRTSCSTPRRATASTSRARWRCCCAWAASPRAWRPASRPGGYSTRKQAWIVRDTDAHAWVEAWFDELGWVDVRPDARRHAGALADRRARRSLPPATRRRRRARPPARPAPAAGRSATVARPARGVRADLLRDPQRTRPTARRRRRRLGARRGGTLMPGPRCAGAGARRGAGLACAARAPARPTAPQRPRDVELEARAAARRPAAADGHDAAPARAAPRRRRTRPTPTCARSAPPATAPTPRAPDAAERRALRRALAQGLGWAGRVRAFWALPPRR